MALTLDFRIDDISPEEERSLEIEAVERAAVARSMIDMSASTPTPAANQGVSALSHPTAPQTNIRPGVNNPQFPFLPQQPQAAFPHALSLPPAQPQPQDDPSLQAQTTEEMMRTCRAFIEQLRSGSAPWLLQRLNNTYGVMPVDPDAFSYWMALVSSYPSLIVGQS